MGITLNKNNIKDLDEFFEGIQDKVDEAIIYNLGVVGMEAVNMARDNITPKKEGGTSYYDDTSNLRSSIGYLIAKNGKVIQDYGFKPIKPSGVKGAQEGRMFAESIVSKYSGYVLVVVAGIYYAEFVEKKVYDVITFTEIEARERAKSMFHLSNELSK